MFKAVIEVKQVGDSKHKLECPEHVSYDEARQDLEVSKNIWENDFISGKVVEC